MCIYAAVAARVQSSIEGTKARRERKRRGEKRVEREVEESRPYMGSGRRERERLAPSYRLRAREITVVVVCLRYCCIYAFVRGVIFTFCFNDLLQIHGCEE